MSQILLEAFNSIPYTTERTEKNGLMDISYTFEDETKHSFRFHFEKRVNYGRNVFVLTLGQKAPNIKMYKRVFGKFHNPLRVIATLIEIIKDNRQKRSDVKGLIIEVPAQAFGAHGRLVDKIVKRELRSELKVQDLDVTIEEFEKLGLQGIIATVKPYNFDSVFNGKLMKELLDNRSADRNAPVVAQTAKKQIVIDTRYDGVWQNAKSFRVFVSTLEKDEGKGVIDALEKCNFKYLGDNPLAHRLIFAYPGEYADKLNQDLNKAIELVNSSTEFEASIGEKEVIISHMFKYEDRAVAYFSSPTELKVAQKIVSSAGYEDIEISVETSKYRMVDTTEKLSCKEFNALLSTFIGDGKIISERTSEIAGADDISTAEQKFHLEHQKGGFKIVTTSPLATILLLNDLQLDLTDNKDGSVYVKLSHFSKTVGTKKQVVNALTAAGYVEGEHVATPGSAASTSKTKLDTSDVKPSKQSIDVQIEDAIEANKGRAEEVLKESFKYNTSGHTVANYKFLRAVRPKDGYVLYVFELMVSPKFGSPVKQKAFVKGYIETDALIGYTGSGAERKPVIAPVRISIDRTVTSWVGYDYEPDVAERFEKTMSFDEPKPTSINWSTAETALKGQYFKDSNYKVVNMKVDELISRQSTDFRIDAGSNTNRIKGRAERALAHIASGAPMDMPVVDIDAQGNLQVVDGRHRIAVAKEMGLKEIPVFLNDAARKPKLFNDLTIKLAKQGNLPQKTINVKGDDVFVTKLSMPGMYNTEERNLSFLMDSNPLYTSIDNQNAEVKRRLLQLVGSSAERIKSAIESWTGGRIKVESVSGSGVKSEPKTDLSFLLNKDISSDAAEPILKYLKKNIKVGTKKYELNSESGVNYLNKILNQLVSLIPNSNDHSFSIGGNINARKAGGLKVVVNDMHRGGYYEGNTHLAVAVQVGGAYTYGINSAVCKFLKEVFANLTNIGDSLPEGRVFDKHGTNFSTVGVAYTGKEYYSKPTFANVKITAKHLVLSEKMNEGIKEDLTGVAPKVNKVDKSILETAMRQMGIYHSAFGYGGGSFTVTMTEGVVDILPVSGNVIALSKLLGVKLGQDLVQDERGGLRFDIA
ncbi:hypothetical protein nACB2_015 [Acinetobacter phage nACB2]|nr:hypothetical protein nACB2_015 [Acinetobacter phage nACB2]